MRLPVHAMAAVLFVAAVASGPAHAQYTAVQLPLPANVTSAQVLGASEGQQVGVGYPSTGSSYPHALLWQGTAASVVDLQPTDPTISASIATTVDATSGYQAGYVNVGAYYPMSLHAYVWQSTAASGIDLNPADFSSSQITAMRGGIQVGFGVPTGEYSAHALVWKGTASSAVDLHSLLPATFVSSQALSVDADGSIVGFASDGRNQVPVIWRLTGSPGVTITQTPQPGTSGWVTGNVTVNIKSPFADTGLSIIYRVNGGASKTVTGSSTSLVLKASGAYQIEAYASDGHGTETAVQAYTANIDVLPPKTGLEYSKFTLTLSARDSNSGVAAAYYVLDGGAAATYRVPLVLANINHQVEYWSVDRAGNVEAHHTASLGASAPKLTSMSPGSALSGSPAVTVTVKGAGFLASSSLLWNGSVRSTTYISTSELQAAIPATDLAAAGTATVKVTNPSPGAGTSGPLAFTISQTCKATGVATHIPETGTSGFDVSPIKRHSGFTPNGKLVHLRTPSGAVFMDASGNGMPAAAFYDSLGDGQSVSVIGTYDTKSNTLTAASVQLNG